MTSEPIPEYTTVQIEIRKEWIVTSSESYFDKENGVFYFFQNKIRNEVDCLICPETFNQFVDKLIVNVEKEMDLKNIIPDEVNPDAPRQFKYEVDVDLFKKTFFLRCQTFYVVQTDGPWNCKAIPSGSRCPMGKRPSVDVGGPVNFLFFEDNVRVMRWKVPIKIVEFAECVVQLDFGDRVCCAIAINGYSCLAMVRGEVTEFGEKFRTWLDSLPYASIQIACYDKAHALFVSKTLGIFIEQIHKILKYK